LFALGIREVGEATARQLAAYFGEIPTLMKADEETLIEIPEVGPIVAQHIVAFFTEPHNRAIIDSLVAHGIHWDAPAVTEKGDKPLDGMRFVLTGGLDTLTRDEAKDQLQSMGAKVSGSVSKQTSYVVAGHDPGSKYQKAKDLGVKILDEQALKVLLETGLLP